MVPVPDPITGSIGSRIRIVLGNHGYQWLLLLNHDTGERKWQDKVWNMGTIPPQLSRQLNNCTANHRDIKAVDFGQTGYWFVHGQKPDGSGSHSWWDRESAASEILQEAVSFGPSLEVSCGTDEYEEETYVILRDHSIINLSDDVHNHDLWERLRMLLDLEKSIHFVRLFDDGQYFISDEMGTRWEVNYACLEDELCDNSKGKIEDVALSENGYWVVIRHNSVAFSDQGLDVELLEKVNQFFADQRFHVTKRNREIREANAANAAHEREPRESFIREFQQPEQACQEIAAAAAAADIAQVNAVARISSLEAALEKRLIEEAIDIKETEERLRQTIRETKEKLLNRKRSLREAMQAMPPGTQSRIPIDDLNSTDSHNICVVCCDRPSVMAAVPCGHVCLCNTCSDVCMSGENGQPTCPLCRGAMQSVLRIYLGS